MGTRKSWVGPLAGGAGGGIARRAGRCARRRGGCAGRRWRRRLGRMAGMGVLVLRPLRGGTDEAKKKPLR